MNKIELLHRESILEFLPNLSKELSAEIYIKRDDEGGRGGGGNKLRKYEKLVADAVQLNCDTLIIAGHYQSNAARELVGVARQLGLESIVVCKEMISSKNEAFNKTGNALLMNLMQVNIVSIDKHADFQLEMDRVAQEVRDKGGKPYIIPFGGSNYLGSLGYIDCAKEIINQFRNMNQEPPDYVIVPTGSGGTHAGLVAGFHDEKVATKVIGFSVLHNKQDATRIVADLTEEILSTSATRHRPDIIVDDRFVGDGYGIPTEEGVRAIRLLAKLEALFLCPVYTGKAMAGLISHLEEGKISPQDRVVFLHTGGTPLLYPFADQLFDEASS